MPLGSYRRQWGQAANGSSLRHSLLDSLCDPLDLRIA